MSEEDPFDCFGSSSSEEDNDDNDEFTHNKNNETTNANSIASPTTTTKNENDESTNNHKDKKPSSREKSSNSSIIETRSRDPSCGICTFHPHTETSLLTHVRNYLSSAFKTGSDDKDHDNNNSHTVPKSATDLWSKEHLQNLLNRSRDVSKAIDDYCTSRHWMMHIGPEKGKILTGALREALAVKQQRRRESEVDGKMETGEERGNKDATFLSPSFVAVELGSYCGYASILIAREYCEARLEALSSSDFNEDGGLLSNLNFHLFSMEINREYAEVARKMINLSGFEELVSVHLISFDGYETNLVDVISSAVQTWERNGGNEVETATKPMIDFLFIDHDKDSYKPDLCRLETSGMVRKGTKVVADNVLFAQIDDYIGYVRKRQEEGVVKTDTVPCRVEYCDGGVEREEEEDGIEEQFGDGVGKLMFRFFCFTLFIWMKCLQYHSNLQKSQIT